jgi:hypothetical protein
MEANGWELKMKNMIGKDFQKLKGQGFGGHINGDMIFTNNV